VRLNAGSDVLSATTNFFRKLAEDDAMNSPAGPQPLLGSLDAIDHDSGLVNAVVETPRGSRCKYKYDATAGLVRLSKLLPLGATFPYNFGFIPSTRGEDGDPLDILVLTDEPLAVGCVVPVRLVGALEAEQTETDGRTVRNDRLVGVVETPYNPPEVRTLDELGDKRLGEVEHFFAAYNNAEGKHFRPVGRHGPDRAERLIEDGRRRAAEASKNKTPRGTASPAPKR
jgi:inorganic pyrophosphatase